MKLNAAPVDGLVSRQFAALRMDHEGASRCASPSTGRSAADRERGRRH
jgi:hypothetical protein